MKSVNHKITRFYHEMGITHHVPYHVWRKAYFTINRKVSNHMHNDFHVMFATCVRNQIYDDIGLSHEQY